MTKKEREIQEATNSLVVTAYNALMERIKSGRYICILPKRLAKCQAYVYETPDCYILKSYNTIVAFIDKENDVFFDFLRLVYGYTATSTQHIRKFRQAYGKEKFGHCKYEYVYREA